MPTPPVPPGRGQKPSRGPVTISEASATLAGRGGGDGTSAHPPWFWGERAMDVAEVGRERTRTSRVWPRSRPPASQQFPKPPLPRPGVGEGTAYPDAGGASGGDCHGCGGTWEAHGSFLVWRKSSAVHVTPPRASGDSVSSGEGISDAEDGRRDADGGKGGSRARRGWVEMTRRRWWLLVAVAA